MSNYAKKPAPLSPEELCEMVNKGATISGTGDGLSVPCLAPAPQTTEAGCSTSEVKDVLPSTPVASDLIESRATPKVATTQPIDKSQQSESIIDFDGVDIKDPVELLMMLDENILSGETSLHDWQIQFMVDFARDDHTKKSPFRACVQACNGSGKDKYIIAACAVWICMRYKEVECPITSSSGAQLDNQTGQHIDRLCAKSNAVFGKLWKVNYRYYEFQHKGAMGEEAPSKIKLFATDEPGKAEGYHPVDAGKKMAIFTSETKSIPEDITGALTRCTGFTHRVDASSPGLPAGYFYNTCMSAIDRDAIQDLKELDSTQTVRYHVTAYQCSHITNEEIEAFASSLPGGKNSVIFKSGIMAEFGTTDEMVVIPSSFVHRAVKAVGLVHKSEPFNTAGLDLSDGGAETVLAIRNGNKLIGLEAFRFEDSEDTIDYLQEKFRLYNLNHPQALIFGDYCGMGGPMLKSLKRKGWSNMRYVDSRNTASEPKTYANRGTELFFNVRLLLERNELILMNDKTLTTQLSTRYYKITTKNIHALLSKLEQKSKGYPSPDRADAVNLAFWNYKSTRVESDLVLPFERPKEDESRVKVTGDFDMLNWANRKQTKYQAEHVSEQDLGDLQEQLSHYNKNRKQLSMT